MDTGFQIVHSGRARGFAGQKQDLAQARGRDGLALGPDLVQGQLLRAMEFVAWRSSGNGWRSGWKHRAG